MLLLCLTPGPGLDCIELITNETRTCRAAVRREPGRLQSANDYVRIQEATAWCFRSGTVLMSGMSESRQLAWRFAALSQTLTAMVFRIAMHTSRCAATPYGSVASDKGERHTSEVVRGHCC